MVLLTHLKPEIIATVRKLILSDDQLQTYMKLFEKKLSRGMDRETCDEAEVKSIITHVNKIPTGNEEGQFLGLDFSGPTIKIMLVKLENRESTVTRKMYDIPKRYMTQSSVKLFDFIAKSLADFLSGIKLKMLRIPLGVTFGFPIEQTSLQECKLIRWTRGFDCKDLIGEDIFVKLKDSIRKFPELKKVYVIGILNDAVSTVLSCAWQDSNCLIGAVLGPGPSFSYAEKTSRVSKYEAETYGVRHIYINIESAEFGKDGSLDDFLTEFDKTLDENSKTPGKQVHEKLVSTDYFGELVRIILLKCIEDKLILEGALSPILNEPHSFKYEHMQKIEKDPDTSHDNCKDVLIEFGYDPTDEDCFQVQFVCRCVSRRSANLSAAQLACIINRINLRSVTIAVGGDLIKNYPNYRWYMTKKLRQIKRGDQEFKLTDAEESILGPAVMAAVFGEEMMNKDEKLRRLPGFPLDKCHFKKIGRCLNPDCNSVMPCDTTKVNPLLKPLDTNSRDLLSASCGESKRSKKCEPCPQPEEVLHHPCYPKNYSPKTKEQPSSRSEYKYTNCQFCKHKGENCDTKKSDSFPQKRKEKQDLFPSTCPDKCKRQKCGQCRGYDRL